ncbi:ComEC/Rec2 family competence protein [uncultured Cohaesibacter sp.]|uniref:ComEC/Rec2 family competence protein n=1 Tax=uncultured Cohaesibacter sp. TaxID=1002546 RepID=UPI0029C88595|nr:ComEC/Rec2 family competence protein [uncultured Cohaesibacter sp.]
MDRASLPAEQDDPRVEIGSRRRLENGYDWQSLTRKPGMRHRFAFWLEMRWQLLVQNWHEDCLDQNARFLWVAFGMSFGAALYYALPDEPSFWGLLAVSAGLACWAYLRARKGLVVFPLLLICAVVVGVCAASEHSYFSTTPVLEHSLSSPVIGRLVRVEKRGDASKPQERWTLAVESIERLPAARTPKRLLLTRRGAGESFPIGARLKIWAHLTPLQQPAYPGGFDYGRYLWSRAIGGQGYLGKTIERLEDGKRSGWSALLLGLGDSIERTRLSVAAYIMHRVEGKAGGLAVALAVGKRDFLAEDVETALRRSGLAHILAISGLHMALVAMSVFWGVRGLLALLPQLSLRYPIKQWSAAMALFCAAAYLIFSGASVATIRAFCMTAIFLVAILAGRPAVTMHNLALVLIMLVIIQPYGVVEAGMQMSFAATAALIASYDRLTRYHLRRDGYLAPNSRGFILGGLANGGRWLLGIGLTSLIASFAVLPYSVAHFQQMAPFGLIANLLAMPVISLVVMPMGLVTVFLTPLGLQSWPLKLAEWGLDWVISMAGMVSGWADADYLVVKAGGDFLPFAAFALAIYVIHRKYLSWLSIIPLCAALALWWLSPQPDLWISGQGTKVASRDADGLWQRTGGRTMTLDYRSLLRADGDGRALGGERKQNANESGKAAQDMAAGCDKQACFVSSLYSAKAQPTNLSLAIVRKSSAFGEECALRDVIVSPLAIPASCDGPAIVIGADALAQTGAHFIYFDQQTDYRFWGWLKGWYPRAGGGEVRDQEDKPLWTMKDVSALPVGKRPWMPDR